MLLIHSQLIYNFSPLPYTIFMKLMRMLLILLSFSLILQNTCPYGFAAKTAFAAPRTNQCPFHHHSTNGQGTVDNNANKVIFPAFVMVVPSVQPCIQRFPVSGDYSFSSSYRYTDPFKEPLIKPPAT